MNLSRSICLRENRPVYVLKISRVRVLNHNNVRVERVWNSRNPEFALVRIFFLNILLVFTADTKNSYSREFCESVWIRAKMYYSTTVFNYIIIISVVRKKRFQCLFPPFARLKIDFFHLNGVGARIRWHSSVNGAHTQHAFRIYFIYY